VRQSRCQSASTGCGTGAQLEPDQRCYMCHWQARYLPSETHHPVSPPMRFLPSEENTNKMGGIASVKYRGVRTDGCVVSVGAVERGWDGLCSSGLHRMRCGIRSPRPRFAASSLMTKSKAVASDPDEADTVRYASVKTMDQRHGCSQADKDH